MSAALTVRVDEAMLARLDAAATERGTTRDVLVRAALQDHLASTGPTEFADWQLALIDEGLAAADRGEFASTEDVEAVFSKHRA
jgi:predicted transcriptional regulator